MYNFRCMDKEVKDYNMYNGNMSIPGTVCPVVYECPIERVCHREIHHTVPHVCPINTRVINHHIYTHTYTPEYTCCEEHDKCDVYEGNCNGF